MFARVKSSFSVPLQKCAREKLSIPPKPINR